MSRKKVILILSVVVLWILAAVSLYEIQKPLPSETPEVENQLPLLVMVNDRLYQMRRESDGEPSSEPDGTITPLLQNVVPYENEQANFGYPDMNYWIMEDSILLQMNDEFLIFEELED